MNFTTDTSLLRQAVDHLADNRTAQDFCHRTAMGWALEEGVKLIDAKVPTNKEKAILLFTDGLQTNENVFDAKPLAEGETNASPDVQNCNKCKKSGKSECCTEEWDIWRWKRHNFCFPLLNPSCQCAPCRGKRYFSSACKRLFCDTHSPDAVSLSLLNDLKARNIAVYTLGYGPNASVQPQCPSPWGIGAPDGYPPRDREDILQAIPEAWFCPQSVCPGANENGEGGERNHVFELRETGAGVKYAVLHTSFPLTGHLNRLNGLAYETRGDYYFVQTGTQGIEQVFEQILQAIGGSAGLRITEKFDPGLLEPVLQNNHLKIEATIGGANIQPAEATLNLQEGKITVFFPPNTVGDQLTLKLYFKIREHPAVFEGCLDCGGSKVEWLKEENELVREQALVEYRFRVKGKGGEGDIYWSDVSRTEIKDKVTADLVLVGAANIPASFPAEWLALSNYYFAKGAKRKLSDAERFNSYLQSLVSYLEEEKPSGVEVYSPEGNTYFLLDLSSLSQSASSFPPLYIYDARNAPHPDNTFLWVKLPEVCGDKPVGIIVLGANVRFTPSSWQSPHSFSAGGKGCFYGVLVALSQSRGNQSFGGGVQMSGSKIEVQGSILASQFYDGGANVVLRRSLGYAELYHGALRYLTPVLEKIYSFYLSSEK